MASDSSRVLGLVMAIQPKMKEDRSVKAKCYSCKFRREVPGNAHIACDNPDGNMTGDPHGVRSGWFMYPILFDPTWCSSECRNFESADPVNHAVQSSGKSK